VRITAATAAAAATTATATNTSVDPKVKDPAATKR